MRTGRGAWRAAVCLLVLLLCIGVALAEQRCPSCGATNPDNARFCKSCGTRLQQQAPARRQAPRVQVDVSVAGSNARITSQPPGASVTVDGKGRGRTPLSLSDLAPGRHELEAERSGYRSYTGSFYVAGKTGTIVVSSDPVGAEILLDSGSRGVTGAFGLVLNQVPYGMHQITARLANYKDVGKAVELASPGPISVLLRLGWGKGLLKVESDPTGAALFLDDTAAGKTPYAAELDPARYRLTLTRKGYYDWVGFADVRYGESLKTKAYMDKILTRKPAFLFAGLAGVAAAIGSTVLAQVNYYNYETAETVEDARAYRTATETWDMARNAGAALGVAGIGLYFALRW